jgi:hypothetical protein
MRLPDGVPRADLLAASISRQLIENGVRAVVAAGWAVDDNAAHEFATTFYSGLLDGRDLGSAALDARRGRPRQPSSDQHLGRIPGVRTTSVPAGSSQRRDWPVGHLSEVELPHITDFLDSILADFDIEPWRNLPPEELVGNPELLDGYEPSEAAACSG